MGPWQTPQGSDPLNYSATRLVSPAQHSQPADASAQDSQQSAVLGEVTERLPGLCLADGKEQPSAGSPESQQPQGPAAEQDGGQGGDGSPPGTSAASSPPGTQEMQSQQHKAAALRATSNGDPAELNTVAHLLEVRAAVTCFRVHAAVR